ncbi:HAD-IA family hydrolase [Actinomadura geliboluensis]|uniref:HAD-IA family hydrolase n=1 Tax=Actinomadura geliboluensis TaxID=882440 RepID=UPI0036B62F1B
MASSGAHRRRPSIEYVPTGEPDPSRYLQAAARLGVDPAVCVVIEDAPAGIAAGRAAGTTVLARGVPRPTPHVRPARSSNYCAWSWPWVVGRGAGPGGVVRAAGRVPVARPAGAAERLRV